MPHETPLITAIVMGLCLAFLFGAIANRLRISPLVGYLLAGVIVGPNTPGFHADSNLTNQLAEIGVILLMFGVGLHFSIKDLLSVRAIALPGALVQMTAATLLGLVLGFAMGWPFSSGLVFGLALSTASTVVLLRAIQERRLIETNRGRIAVGWLIVEDLAMVLVLVLLPALSKTFGVTESSAVSDPILANFNPSITVIIAFTLIKVILFVALMMLVGRRVIPWLLKIIAQAGSRELFSLAVLAIALGVAFGAAHLFGVSLALGAFFAGMIMSESEFSHRAAEETLPLRDAFAVLFFVSVGMLFEPIKIFRDFIPLLATLFIIIFGKSLAAFLIVRAFRHPVGTALVISASLAQIGEFSFILATVGYNLTILNSDARDLILGGAILSIMLNPLTFLVADRLNQRFELPKTDEASEQNTLEIPIPESENQLFQSSKTDHTIVVGFGDIGQRVTHSLVSQNIPVLIIEDNGRYAEKARNENFEIITGNAAYKDILSAANLSRASHLILTMSNPFEAGPIISQVKHQAPDISIVAHTNSEEGSLYLKNLGADHVITNDQQIAQALLDCLFYHSPILQNPSQEQEAGKPKLPANALMIKTEVPFS